MNLKKPACAVLFFFLFSVFAFPAFAQIQRPRIVPNSTADSINSNQVSLVKKTSLSTPKNPIPNNFISNQSLAAFNERLHSAMQARLGIRYVYGSTGPNTYDCSGLIWSVFQDAGINFERSSARTFWVNFEPVYGDERYKFGTLVFFNGLGHVGIVVNDEGFYHASSSKGVTYSPFAGYWEKRVVGFRRVPQKAS